ncbi:hypothetical protein GYMLUDRAFT_102786, partial [Collybiopsis luxurians FD-317 M1]
WVPGCIGVEGNEAADREAKKAALHGSSNKWDLPKVFCKVLSVSVSAIKKAFQWRLNTLWDDMFGSSLR